MCVMKKRQVESDLKALGPYSLGIAYANTLYLSAQLPLNLQGEVVAEGVKQQCIQAIENIEHILESNDLSLNDVIRTTLYLTDIEDYACINQVYAIYFSHPYPARTVMEVARLPKGAKVQIECVVSSKASVGLEYEDECGDCD